MNNNLSKIMGERRISTAKIARETKISRTTLRSIYYEEADNVKLSTLKKFAIIYAVHYQTLLNITHKNKHSVANYHLGEQTQALA